MRTIGWITVSAVVLSAVAVGCEAPEGLPGSLRGLTPYLAQIHLHGLSNHNGSDEPASMQWHSWYAAKAGFDVLWWTDHEHGFDLTEDFVLDPRSGRVDPQSLEVAGIAGFRRMVTRFQPEITGGRPGADLDGKRLTMRITSSGRDVFDRFGYVPESEFGRIRSTSWVRPVTSGLELRGRMEVRRLDENGRIDIEARLSWHVKEHAAQDTVEVHFLAGEDRPETRAINDRRVEVRLPLPAGWESGEAVPFAVDFLEPASLLPFGDDNTLSELAFGVAARNGATAEVAFSDLTLHSRDPEPEHQIAEITRLADRYEREYGLVEHVGIEFGYLHTTASPHMDAHFPGSVPDFPSLCRLYNADPREWVKAVHAAGGLVTVNHIFGAAGRRGSARTPDEMRKVGREIAEEVLALNAYGGDVFEAGYLMRAGASLDDYLHVWDVLLANGYAIYGDATSDCHGGEWGPDMTPNPMATWILAPDTEPASLIAAMRGGRMYFGNPFLWQGELVIWTGAGWMGDHVSVDGPSAELRIYLDPIPANADVRLVQGVLKGGIDVEYIHDRTPVDPASPVTLATDRPSFARVEVYSRASADSLTPIVFSNPIFFVNPE